MELDNKTIGWDTSGFANDIKCSYCVEALKHYQFLDNGHAILKKDIEEKTTLLKKENKKEGCCKDFDIRYWGFTQWLAYGIEYFRCNKSDSGDVCIKITCCPLVTAGWIVGAPFSCLGCCCCCPHIIDDAQKSRYEIDARKPNTIPNDLSALPWKASSSIVPTPDQTPYGHPYPGHRAHCFCPACFANGVR